MNAARFTLILLVAVALIASATMEASAAKGGKGKPPKNPTATPTPGGGGCPDNGGGTIYYVDINGTAHALDADCGTDTALTDLPRNMYRPSNAEHAGKRWFLNYEHVIGLGYYPDGDVACELVTFDEAGNRVQLTDYTSGGTVMSDLHYDCGSSSFEWASDDGFVSWTAKRWVDDDSDGDFDSVAEAGVYRSAVTFDTSGNITGLSDPAPATPVVALNLDGDGDDANVGAHGWSPDASQLIYGVPSGGLWRVDTVPSTDPNTHVQIRSDGRRPDWSPTGEIVFHTSGTLYSINPDGSGQSRIANDKRLGVSLPYWSPTGSHVLYVRGVGSKPDETMRVGADGSGKTKLADGWPIGWVAAP